MDKAYLLQQPQNLESSELDGQILLKHFTCTEKCELKEKPDQYVYD